MGYAFWGTTPNLNYAVNRLNQAVFGISDGNGSTASNKDVENAVKWAINIANDDTHGYDQAHRTGPDYDCSSLVCSAFKQAGFDVPITSTHYMRNAFTAVGFRWYPRYDENGTVLWNGNCSVLSRGDIVLKEAAHTELYIGNNQNVGAHCNEFGGITGGETGDQTGEEICVDGYWDYPWDGYLHYVGN